MSPQINTYYPPLVSVDSMVIAPSNSVQLHDVVEFQEPISTGQEALEHFHQLEAEDVEPPSLWNRFWGGAKVLFGTTQAMVAGTAAAATSWTGIGGVGFGALALHGADTAISGARQLWTGRETHSGFSQGIEYLTGSETAGEVSDAALGLVGTAGLSYARVAPEIAAMRLPAKQVEVWKYGRLPSNVLGATDALGGITIQKGLKEDVLESTLNHELVHRFLSPRGGLFLDWRAKLRMAGYEKSHLLRYAEEALAEGYATGSLKQGLRFPLEYGYGIELGQIGKEAAVAATGFGQAANTTLQATDTD